MYYCEKMISLIKPDLTYRVRRSYDSVILNDSTSFFDRRKGNSVASRITHKIVTDQRDRFVTAD